MSIITEDSLTHTVETVEMLRSVYYSDEEFRFRSNEDKELHQQLEQHYQDETLNTLVTLWKPTQTLAFQVLVNLEGTIQQSLTSSSSSSNNSSSSSKSCDSNTATSLLVDGWIWLAEPQRYRLAISTSEEQNHWLDRSMHEQLTDTLETEQQRLEETEEEEESAASRLMMILQELPAIAQPILDLYIDRQRQQQEQQRLQERKDKEADGPLKCIREWLWLPMIYTKEKRGHIVNWAPSYNITGFLFAGKPGCLLLEGTEKSVASFINDIKTVSWADIPAGHKKISTKLQERFTCTDLNDLQQKRKFHTMTELKFETSGKFRNHNDLDTLKKWMKEHQVDYAFHHLFDYE